jgi:hypothetical protein
MIYIFLLLLYALIVFLIVRKLPPFVRRRYKRWVVPIAVLSGCVILIVTSYAAGWLADAPGWIRLSVIGLALLAGAAVATRKRWFKKA